jgi:hypothetical protein
MYHPITQEVPMSSETIFRIQLVLGYVAWLFCFGTYILPRLRAMDRLSAQRAIATLHSFRFFGLIFILPGILDGMRRLAPRRARLSATHSKCQEETSR